MNFGALPDRTRIEVYGDDGLPVATAQPAKLSVNSSSEEHPDRPSKDITDGNAYPSRKTFKTDYTKLFDGTPAASASGLSPLVSQTPKLLPMQMTLPLRPREGQSTFGEHNCTLYSLLLRTCCFRERIY
jgi:hypothetical protein